MNWFYLIVGGLVTFRLSLLVSKESGPAFIFRKLRAAPPKHSSASDGLQCIFCVSVWTAAPVTAYEWYLGWITPLETPLYWLALSALAIFANQAFTKGKL